jgi:sialate O-acetylesterase
MAKNVLIIILAMLSSFSIAQTPAVWKNKKCAVVLTYDDALNVHLDNVVPALDALGLKGTFYLSAYFPGCSKRVSEWKTVGSHGHELANHTLFHPCVGKKPGREFVKPDYDLGNYSLQRIADEIRMTNVFLHALDGKTKRTFAYPCGDTMAGDSSYVDKIRNDFVSARGVKGEMLQTNEIDLFNVGSYMINGQTGEQMIDLVKAAMEKNTMIVFLFHGVGGEHGLNVSLAEHQKLLKFLKQNESDIWIAPFLEVTEHVKSYRQKSKSQSAK